MGFLDVRALQLFAGSNILVEFSTTGARSL